MSHKEALQAYKTKDYDRAYAIWEDESKKENDQAMTNIGLMYLKGDGVEKDFTRAREWFLKASEYDNDSANYNLALMYQTKLGVEEDMDKSISYFRKAVAKNHQNANFRLGYLLLKDRTNEESVKEGFECILSAAKSNHPMAISMVGGLDSKPNLSAKLNITYRTSPYEKQIEILTDAIDRYIRPILVKDGGNIMILDYVNKPDIEIRLAYQGNCAGCSMAATSTYGLIRDTLSKVIDENILVYVI